MAYAVSLPNGMTVVADTAREAAELVALLGGAAPALPTTPRIEPSPPRIAADAASTPLDAPVVSSGSTGRRGRKMDSGKGGVYPTGSGSFRFKARVGGRQVCGPSRATREEAEDDLGAATAPVRVEATPSFGASEPTSFMDSIARAPRRGPHEVGRIGPKSSPAARVVHSLDAPTTGEGFARCGARGDSVLVTGKTSAVNCVECLRLAVEDRVLGLARAALAPEPHVAAVNEREETRQRNLAELREMAAHISDLPPRLRAMAEEALSGKRATEIASNRSVTVQTVHQAMSQARRILRRAAYVAGERPSAAPPPREAPAGPGCSSFAASDEVPKEEVAPARAVKSHDFPAAPPVANAVEGAEDLSAYEAALVPGLAAPGGGSAAGRPPASGNPVSADRRRGPRSPEIRASIAAAARASWARRRGAAAPTPPRSPRIASDAAPTLLDAAPATCPESQTDPSCLTDDDQPPLRKAQRRCSRCGIPGHRSSTCAVQPLTREDRLLAIEAWATRRRAPAPPAPAATAAPPPLVCRTFDADEDFTEFLPEETPEPPEPAGAVGATLPPTPAPALTAPADHPPIAEPDAVYPDQRPATRGQCERMPRPCPFVSCKMHLAIEVSQHTGAILESFSGRDPDDLEETCALDVSSRGGVTLEVVGRLLSLTRERIGQIETRGLAQLARRRGDIEAAPARGSNAPEDAIF